MIVLALLVVAYAINPELANKLGLFLLERVMGWFPKKNPPAVVKVEVGKSRDC